MEIKEYQKLAMRTSTEDHDRVLNGCLGLIGETGEIVDIVKKWKFQSGNNADLPADKLIDECGDVLWYCAELATGMHDNLADMYCLACELFDCVREMTEETDPAISAARMSLVAAEIFRDYDSPYTEDVKWLNQRVANIKSNIVGMMVMIRDFLEIHCKVTLSGAMDYNIAKLRARYPDGFDPERSMHREEAEAEHE